MFSWKLTLPLFVISAVIIYVLSAVIADALGYFLADLNISVEALAVGSWCFFGIIGFLALLVGYFTIKSWTL